MLDYPTSKTSVCLSHRERRGHHFRNFLKFFTKHKILQSLAFTIYLRTYQKLINILLLEKQKKKKTFVDYFVKYQQFINILDWKFLLYREKLLPPRKSCSENLSKNAQGLRTLDPSLIRRRRRRSWAVNGRGGSIAQSFGGNVGDHMARRFRGRRLRAHERAASRKLPRCWC